MGIPILPEQEIQRIFVFLAHILVPASAYLCMRGSFRCHSGSGEPRGYAQQKGNEHETEHYCVRITIGRDTRRRWHFFRNLCVGGVANAQMYLPEPSDSVAGTPLNSTEFRGIDTSRDGFENVALGMPFYDEGDPQFGEVRVLSTSNPDDDLTVYGEQPNDLFGFRVAGVSAPLWLDNTHNLLVSAPNWDGGDGAVGRVYLIEGTTGNILHVFEGNEVDSSFGWSIAAIGDITGNWISDIAIGAPHAGPESQGRVYLYDGDTGQLIDQIDGTSPQGLFGASLTAGGDLTWNGFGDFAVGAPGNHNGLEGIGKVFVYDGLTRSLICEIVGEASHGRFGIALDGGFDVDGDGMPNLVIGAPGVPNAQTAVDLLLHSDTPSGQGGTSGGSHPLLPEYIHSSGRVYVFSAANIINHEPDDPLHASSADRILVPSVAGDMNYGLVVEIGNDVTQDGLANIIVSSTFEPDEPGDTSFLLGGGGPQMAGRTYVSSGVDGTEVTSYTENDDVEEESEYVDFCDHYPDLCAHMVSCESMEDTDPPCAAACHCTNSLVSKYNRRVRNYNRAVKTAAVSCAIVCIATPFTGPFAPVTFGVCLTCAVGTVGIAAWEEMNLRNFLSDGWDDCFNDNGCVPPPPFPFW